VIVEVAPARNAPVDAGILGSGGTVALYAATGDEEISIPVRQLMVINARWQFVLVYTEPAAAKDAGIADITAALGAGAIRVGAEAGLPLHHYPLAETGAAHRAVEDGAVGKVLIDV
jgi:NADPH:quinone reductase